MLKQIGSITIKHHKIDDIVKCLEKAGFVAIVEYRGFLESTFLIAEAVDTSSTEAAE